MYPNKSEILVLNNPKNALITAINPTKAIKLAPTFNTKFNPFPVQQ